MLSAGLRSAAGRRGSRRPTRREPRSALRAPAGRRRPSVRPDAAGIPAVGGCATTAAAGSAGSPDRWPGCRAGAPSATARRGCGACGVRRRQSRHGTGAMTTLVADRGETVDRMSERGTFHGRGGHRQLEWRHVEGAIIPKTAVDRLHSLASPDQPPLLWRRHRSPVGRALRGKPALLDRRRFRRDPGMVEHHLTLLHCGKIIVFLQGVAP